MNNNLEEKKEYVAPKMTVVKIEQSEALLCGSGCDDGYIDYGDGEAE